MRAKERLTGAIILVALIVLVVPELLTGPRRAAPSDVARSSAEALPMRSYTIELTDEGAARPAQPRSQATADAQAAMDAEVVTDANPTPPVPVPKATPEARSAKSEKPEPQREAPPAVRAAPAAASAPADRKRPLTGWAIQVGSFASAANAERLAGELRRLGFQSFVAEATSGGRRLYRVRVGPESDRASAQALAARLEAATRGARDEAVRLAGRAGTIVAHP